MLLGAGAYLAMPIDLVPDFIPVLGQLDDAFVVALALRAVLRGAGADLVAEHSPRIGPLARRRRAAGRSPPALLSADRGGERQPQALALGEQAGLVHRSADGGQLAQ